MTVAERAQVIAIVGPTATGKSELALRVGEALGGAEAAAVIGADAMALYQGMDIGTAKVSPREQARLPHYQVDVLPVTARASVAKYQEQATEQVNDLLAARRTPLVVGGSGLYVRALLDQLQFPPTDSKVRERLEALAREKGSAAMHEVLTRLDPKAAAAIEPNNARRVVRALEVIDVTGEPFSATMPTYDYHWPTVQIGLTAPLEVLDERILRRAHQMFDGGLVDEVRNLIPLGIEESRTAQFATGYRQALAVARGEMSEDEARLATAQATSQLARKQLKWFKRDARVRWIDISKDDAWEETKAALQEAGLTI